jgi:predicted Zn-dependent protease
MTNKAPMTNAQGRTGRPRHFAKGHWDLRRFLLLLPLLLTLGCAISQEKEIQLGQEAAPQFEREFGGLYPDRQVQAYVNEVGLELAAQAGRPGLPWQFRVLNSDQVNAFALPGGFIYVTQGLLFRMENEAMLAGVLGHEVGHVAHRHSVKQIQRTQTAQGLSAVAGIVGALFGFGGVGDVTNVVASLTLMTYSRGQEKESDLSGLRYMTRTGYNPEGMVQTMHVLQQASGGGGGPPQFLSSHPNPGNRIEYLTETIEKRYPQAADTGDLGADRFQRAMGRRVSLALAPLRLAAVDWCGTCRRGDFATDGAQMGHR